MSFPSVPTGQSFPSRNTAPRLLYRKWKSYHVTSFPRLQIPEKRPPIISPWEMPLRDSLPWLVIPWELVVSYDLCIQNSPGSWLDGTICGQYLQLLGFLGAHIFLFSFCYQFGHCYSHIFKTTSGTSLMVQWLKLCTPRAGAQTQSGWELDPIPQLRLVQPK